MLGIVLGSGYRAVNKRNKSPYPKGVAIPVGRTDKTQYDVTEISINITTPTKKNEQDLH